MEFGAASSYEITFYVYIPNWLHADYSVQF